MTCNSIQTGSAAGRGDGCWNSAHRRCYLCPVLWHGAAALNPPSLFPALALQRYRKAQWVETQRRTAALNQVVFPLNTNNYSTSFIPLGKRTYYSQAHLQRWQVAHYIIPSENDSFQLKKRNTNPFFFVPVCCTVAPEPHSNDSNSCHLPT